MQRRSTDLPFSIINGYTYTFFFLFFSLAFFFSFSCSYKLPNTATGNQNDDFSVLLAFKSTSDSSNSLVSWTSGGGGGSGSGSDPCSTWVGVTCHPITRRVTKLVLNHLNLTGSVQVLALLRQLRHLSLHHNRLSSSTLDFTHWPDLRHLYLSHNHFTGKFPSGVSHLRGLRRLDISYNGFFGEIPFSELTHLSHLLTLRLEFNSFNGTLSTAAVSSPSLASSLSDFNVSENGLTGKIPDWLSNFQASAFAGNRHLCGKPLLTGCPVKPVIADPSSSEMTDGGPLPIGVTDIKKKKKGSKADMILMIILVDAASLLLIILTIGFCCYYKKTYARDDKNRANNPSKKRFSNLITTTMDDAGGEMVFFEGCNGFTRVDELLKASAEMLGKGTVGTTYRVVMDGGEVVVVKRIREKVKRVKEMSSCLKEIGGLRHPNVVSLRAYYSSKEELLLVYDFLQNGSLHNLLHGNRGPGRTPLDWPTRLRFALGSAEGLAFIHGYTKSKHLLHLHQGHLTSSNIIIDNNGNACIADAGLYQLLQLTLPLSLSSSNNNNNNNNAYKAPELLHMMNNNNGNGNGGGTVKLNGMQKCDVYSFGVILVELLTGKMVSQGEMVRLGKCFGGTTTRNNGEWKWDVFDFELVRHKEMEEEMIALLKIAMLCLVTSPKDRPKMSSVHKMIQDITMTITSSKTTTAPAPASASAMDQQSSHSSNSV